MARTGSDKELLRLLEEELKAQSQKACGADRTHIWEIGDKTFEGVGKTQVYEAKFKWPKA